MNNDITQADTRNSNDTESEDTSAISDLNKSSRKPVGEDVDTDNKRSKDDDDSVLAEINGPAKDND